MDNILRLFPSKMKQALKTYTNNNWIHLEEIRLRLNKPIELNFSDDVRWLNGIIFTETDRVFVINQLSEFSLYRLTDELREGYITINGGHRVGIAGEVTTENGALKHIQHITFLNIRLAKDIHTLAHRFIHHLYEHPTYVNTLIIGAPQTGKTTLLRDIARLISSGMDEVQAKKVSVIDERSEIAAAKEGIPQYDLGKRTDVMDACPKVSGMMMMIRSMSPEILIVDEIGGEEDVSALMEAVLSGVTVICSVHSSSVREAKRRPSLRSLFNDQLFKRFVILSKRHKNTYTVTIENNQGDKLLNKFIVER